jgi:phenylalanine-4-hydroxylase
MRDPVDLTGRVGHSKGLRGDYSRMRPDYTVDQEYSAYTEVHQDTWRRLYARQRELVPDRACSAYLEALGVLETLRYGDAIPRFGQVNEKLHAATRWSLVPVPGLLPDEVFFSHLAQRRFPTTVWIREPEEFDYIVEPDLFHDFFGHVPMIFSPAIADYLQAYGEGGLKAARLGSLKYLARLYWYTIEFGLVREGRHPRAYGAGILSSPAELRHSVEAEGSHRIEFDLIRAMQTRYLIDDFQKTYFVIDSFGQLFRETAPDFSLLYRALERLPELDADSHLPTDHDAAR